MADLPVSAAADSGSGSSSPAHLYFSSHRLLAFLQYRNRGFPISSRRAKYIFHEWDGNLADSPDQLFFYQRLFFKHVFFSIVKRQSAFLCIFKIIYKKCKGGIILCKICAHLKNIFLGKRSVGLFLLGSDSTHFPLSFLWGREKYS